MKYTQNEKILQVTERTLIVGVDIASETHYGRVFDQRGVELGKVIRFSNDAEGFKALVSWVEEIKAKCNKHKVIVGMEPTGHYWFNIAPYLKDHKMKIVLVNPFHVKRSKELDDNNPTKNDRKDPKTIAMLVKDGRYMEPYIPEGIYSELRIAMETRWQIVKQLNVVRNRVKRWISIYFPEFNRVFGDWEGKAALIALKGFPTPAKALEKGVDGIIAGWKQDKLRAVGKKRATELIDAAKVSVGVSEGLVAAENDLAILLEDYEMRMRQYERTMVMIEQLAYQIPGMPEMLKINCSLGRSPAICAIFASFVLRGIVPELQAIVEEYKKLLRKAGRELADSLKLSEGTKKELEKPLIPYDAYVNGWNNSIDMNWNRSDMIMNGTVRK